MTNRFLGHKFIHSDGVVTYTYTQNSIHDPELTDMAGQNIPLHF